MTSEYKLIIYDNDDTLAPTSDIINGILIETLHKYAPPTYKQFDADFVTYDCVGITIQDVFTKMAERSSVILPPDIQDTVLREYQGIYAKEIGKKLPQDPEQIEIIQFLSREFIQCVASNGRRKNVEATVAAVGVADIITPRHIVSAEDPVVEHPKPAPDMIIHIMHKMGMTDPSQVVFLDDSPHGCKAGLAAGVVTVGFTKFISDKSSRTAALHDVGVRHIVDNWRDFQRFVLGN